MTSTGTPFWSGPKRCPKPAEFSLDCPVHLDFIVAAANLRAEVYGIKDGVTRDTAAIIPVIKKANVLEFKPKEGVKIAATDAEAQVNKFI